MEDKQKGYDIYHTCHGLVWYKKEFPNSYLTRIHHVGCFVYQETATQENGLLYNTSSRIYDQHLYYIEHYTPCYSIFFTWFFVCFTLSKIPRLRDSLDKCFWNHCAKLTSAFFVAV